MQFAYQENAFVKTELTQKGLPPSIWGVRSALCSPPEAVHNRYEWSCGGQNTPRLISNPLWSKFDVEILSQIEHLFTQERFRAEILSRKGVMLFWLPSSCRSVSLAHDKTVIFLVGSFKKNMFPKSLGDGPWSHPGRILGFLGTHFQSFLNLLSVRKRPLIQVDCEVPPRNTKNGLVPGWGGQPDRRLCRQDLGYM